MPRLTPQEIKQHRAWMEQWREPNAMQKYFEEVSNYMGSDTGGVSSHLFNQTGISFLLEAFIAAQFSELRGAKLTRLIADDQPDFQLKIGSIVESWELTEGDVIGRKRGQEYIETADKAATGISTPNFDPGEEWVARSDQVPAILHACATKKARKNYPSETRLLIYLNIGEYGIRQKEIEGCMMENTSPAKDAFQEVWVLWKQKTYRLWSDGNSCSLSL